MLCRIHGRLVAWSPRGLGYTLHRCWWWRAHNTNKQKSQCTAANHSMCCLCGGRGSISWGRLACQCKSIGVLSVLMGQNAWLKEGMQSGLQLPYMDMDMGERGLIHPPVAAPHLVPSRLCSHDLLSARPASTPPPPPIPPPSSCPSYALSKSHSLSTGRVSGVQLLSHHVTAVAS